MIFDSAIHGRRFPHAQCHRRRLAAHFVQRRRADIRHFMQADTPFPDRLVSESTYALSPDYKDFFDKVLKFITEPLLL